MEDRHNPSQINTVVAKFVDRLCDRLEEVSDDSDADDPSPLFSAGKDMSNRFDVIIKPVYDSILSESANGVKLDKDQIFKLWKNHSDKITDCSHKLFGLFCLSSWMNKFSEIEK